MYPNPYAPAPAPRRSSIPKVIGILLIIFGCLGILGSLIGLVKGSDDVRMLLDGDEFSSYRRVTLIFGVIGLGVSFLQLMAGMSCARYKSNGPGLALTYALTTMIFQIANAVATYTYLRPMLAKISGGLADMAGMFMMVGLVFSLAWPIVVLALMTRPNAKAACTW